MNFYAKLPLLFAKFWFFDAPSGLGSYFFSFNKAFLELFSLGLLLRTFFKPWKNEYRKNFIAVALGIGIVVKSSVIFADLVILAFLLACELACIVALVVLPFATIYMLFL